MAAWNHGTSRHGSIEHKVLLVVDVLHISLFQISILNTILTYWPLGYVEVFFTYIFWNSLPEPMLTQILAYDITKPQWVNISTNGHLIGNRNHFVISINLKLYSQRLVHVLNICIETVEYMHIKHIKCLIITGDFENYHLDSLQQSSSQHENLSNHVYSYWSQWVSALKFILHGKF